MALLLPNHNAIFLHVPKTGGLFITDYLRKIRVPFHMIGYRHSPADLIGWNHVNKFKFCFIRNPISWYRSYWQMRFGETGGNGGHLGIGQDLGGPHPLFHPTWEIDPYCMNRNLNKFVLNCAELDGYLVRMYKRFIGHGMYKVDYVGRFEHFHEDLMTVFDRIKLRYNKQDLIKAPKYNPSKKTREIGKVTSEILWKAEAQYENIKTGWM